MKTNDRLMPKKYGVLSRVIRVAIAGNSSSFTAASIAETVRTLNPKLNVDRIIVSKALIRLMKTGEIQLVTAGTGRSPSIYIRNNLFVRIKNVEEIAQAAYIPTKREYFAAKAMQGELASQSDGEVYTDFQRMADRCVRAADAVLTQLAATEGTK